MNGSDCVISIELNGVYNLPWYIRLIVCLVCNVIDHLLWHAAWRVLFVVFEILPDCGCDVSNFLLID